MPSRCAGRHGSSNFLRRLGHPVLRDAGHRQRRGAGPRRPRRRRRRARTPARTSPRAAVRLGAGDPRRARRSPRRRPGRLPRRAAAPRRPARPRRRGRMAARDRAQRLPDAAAPPRARAARSTRPTTPTRPATPRRQSTGSRVSDWLWTALERLPDDQRVTIMLRYFGRHAAYEEIAATLGIPVGTVRSRLNQAKSRLADDLLRTASAAHNDHAKLLTERKQEWDAIVHEAYTTGAAPLYVANCAPDVLVEAPSMAYRERRRRRPAARRRGHRRRRRTTRADEPDRQRHRHDLGRRLPQPTRRPSALPGDPHRGAPPPRRTDDQTRPVLPTPSDADRPLTTPSDATRQFRRAPAVDDVRAAAPVITDCC